MLSICLYFVAWSRHKHDDPEIFPVAGPYMNMDDAYNKRDELNTQSDIKTHEVFSIASTSFEIEQVSNVYRG